MERHVRDAAYVDADCRQDSPGPDATCQSLLACHALPHSARPDDVTHPLRYAHVSNRFRLHRPPALDPDERRVKQTDDASSSFGCRFLSRAVFELTPARPRPKYPRDTE